MSSIHGLDVYNNGEDRQNGHSDFGGGEDDVTSAAVGLVLDSLDDIHCLLEAKYQVIHTVRVVHANPVIWVVRFLG